MRKSFFTLMLAIVSSVCMMKAACLMQAPEAMYQPFETVSGTLTSIGFPCEGEEPCPTCLTIALVTDAKTYYLSTSDAQMQAQLDELEMQLPLRATISGTPFVNGSFDFIKVLSVSVVNSLLPSLCDEWNVLEISNVTCGYCEEYRTYNFHLTTDTVIGGLLYSQLIKDGAYKGALREGNNRDIYCVPAGCSQEYLLYAFNAQVGDSLKNIWVGGYSSWIPDVRSAIVSEIKQTTPRTIELEVHYYEAPDAYEESIRNLTWIEGIGMPSGPMGAECSVFNGCADSKAKLLLCAYKNGEQVYVSEMGEQYGCEYNYDPNTNHTDTIPLYAQDDPGSSTVDPVDPNQVLVTLKGDELTIRESSGEEIMMALSLNQGDASVPAFNRVQRTQSFQNELTVTLTEEGLYRLELSNPSWGYNIFGTFNYPQRKDAIDQNVVPTPAAQKIIRNGQLLIRKGGKIYTVQGAEVNE